MEWWRPFLTRLVAADPGMRRFRAATQTLLRAAIHQLGRLRGVPADLSHEFGPRPATAPTAVPS